MGKSITREQFEEIKDAISFHDRETAYSLLNEYTGIEVRPYTAWAFYDCFDNWLGDSDNYSIRDILKNADIDII